MITHIKKFANALQITHTIGTKKNAFFKKHETKSHLILINALKSPQRQSQSQYVAVNRSIRLNVRELQSQHEMNVNALQLPRHRKLLQKIRICTDSGFPKL